MKIGKGNSHLVSKQEMNLFPPPENSVDEIVPLYFAYLYGKTNRVWRRKKNLPRFFLSWSRSPKYQRPEKTPQYRTHIFPNIDVKLKSCY